jgi:ATP-binding cassette, subfamily B, bacterial
VTRPKFSAFKNFFYILLFVTRIAWKVNRTLFITLTATSALKGLLILPSLLLTKLFVDTILTAIRTQDVIFGFRQVIIWSLLTLLVDIVRSGLERYDNTASRFMARYCTLYVQTTALEKVNSLSVSDSENPAHRNLFQKVIDRGGESTWGIIMPLFTLPETVFSLISAAIPIFTYQPLFILPAFLIVLPEIIVSNRFSKAEYELSTRKAPVYRVWEAYENFLSKGKYLYENKILNHYSELVSRIRILANQVFGETFRLRTTYARRRFFASWPVSFFTTGARLYFYYQAILQTMTLGTAQMLSAALTGFVGSFSGLVQQMNSIIENFLFVQDFNTLINLPSESDTKISDIETEFSQGIEFRDVWFKYPSSPDWIIKGTSFTVGPRDNIAIVGKNGAGKTTLIKLICRFYDPQKGQILVNGHDIRDYSPQAYREAISALFQDFAQYPFSAMENIGFGDIKQQKNFEKIVASARLAGIDEFINSLPQGYENPLENEFEKGIEPSKGQWQRLALARALFRSAPMLILDEPTSNVDPKAEEEIFENILRVAAEKMVILVSHRFSTVRKADQILVLDKGKIIEQGSHEQLMHKNGTYAKLFQLQAKSYK